ncbi:hypothetical protein ACWCXH_26165 [Kitasatospora sp. NPDC001660]
MTRYCVDPACRELIATWGTGEGDLATRIATAPADTDPAALSRLARALTQLSTAAWRTYTHPASAADSLEVNSEGWRWEQEREAFEEVAGAVAAPNLPEGGMLTVSYTPVLESAHRVGRALHALNNPDLTQAVRTETATELAAVESAELGDLTDRAQQAVLLSREDASPVQVAAADRLFEEDPFGSPALFTDVDPTAAAVAAAHWLHAAAEVASAASGATLTTVVQAADDIEALAHETPTIVLELLDEGASPHEAVTSLVRDALQVADGILPEPDTFREQLDQTQEMLTEYGDDAELELSGLRLTPLDPQRPALDLLEDLVAGIHGCWLIHDEYTETADHEGDDLAAPSDKEWDEEAAEELHRQRSRGQFATLVRATAVRNHDRLT